MSQLELIESSEKKQKCTSILFVHNNFLFSVKSKDKLNKMILEQL